MNENNKLSILIPVYDEKESFLHVFNNIQNVLTIYAEIIIIYDFDEDNTLIETKKANIYNKKINLKVVKNVGEGVKGAILTGLKESSYENIFITTIDEVVPVFAYEKMFNYFIKNNLDFLNATRYNLGAKRYGGSLIGHTLSYIANTTLYKITKFPLSDATTGMKMFKKEIMNDIELNISETGWSFTLEFSIKCYLNNLRIDEYPMNSLDRIFGGYSKFKLGPWFKDYLKIFMWGIIKIYNKK